MDGACMTTWKPSEFIKNGKRKHRHWRVTIFYKDGERFVRVYLDRERANRFAERERKSPVVRMARVTEVGPPLAENVQANGKRSPEKLQP